MYFSKIGVLSKMIRQYYFVLPPRKVLHFNGQLKFSFDTLFNNFDTSHCHDSSIKLIFLIYAGILIFLKTVNAIKTTLNV